MKNSKVIFNARNLESEFIQDDMNEILKFENQEAIVTEIAQENSDNKDHNYYDIKFNDGSSFEAISGYHLTEVKKEESLNEKFSRIRNNFQPGMRSF